MALSSGEQDRYILHLNHALAMESALIDHLEKRAAAVPHANVRDRLLQHREETRQHADTVRGIIESLKGEPTSTKAVVQPAISPGMLGKVMTALESEKSDRLLNEDLADYAVENYEAALYSALGLIATNLGFSQHATQFERIRQQELAMAEFIANGQPDAIREAFPTRRAA
jgi:ferritin-like metal-binding protein YciE